MSLSIFATLGVTTTASAAPIELRYETADSNPAQQEHGLYSSIALDSSDRPHIAYFAVTNGLRYAIRGEGGLWDVQTVDPESGAGRFAALRLDSAGRPGIAYTNNEYIRYAHWTGDAWSITTIVEAGASLPSLALDAAGRPHIAYSQHSLNELHYAHWTGDAWTIDVVDSSGDVRTGNTGTSIALDSAGRPGIAYSGGAGNSAAPLKYAALTDDGWNVSATGLLTARSTTAGTLGAKGSVSLAYDSSDRPHIALQRSHGSTSSMIYYGSHNGEAWDLQLVYGYSTGEDGWGLSMALDDGDKAHIVFLHWSSEIIYLTNQGGSWESTLVMKNTPPGSSAIIEQQRYSIALDSAGRPHIAYYSKGCVMYATAPRWAPSWTSTPAQDVTLKHSYSYTPAANESAVFSVVSKPYWLTWDGTTLSGTAPASLGTYAVELTAQSIAGMGTSSQTWTITVDGWRPAYTTNPPTSIVVGDQYSYTAGLNESVTISSVTLPPWMTRSGATLSGTPTETGSWQVSIRAVGPGLLYAYQNWTVTASVWAPSWTTAPDYAATVEMPYSYTPALNESATIEPVSLPYWLTWDGTTLSGAPASMHVGAHQVSLRAVDGPGRLTSYHNWTITVNDRDRWMPIISSSPADRVAVTDPYSYTIQANESVTIMYSGPGWLHLDGMTISGTAPTTPQTVHVSLRITSVAGTLSYWQNWTISVWATPPYIPDPPTISVPPGESYSYGFGGPGWGTGGDRELSLDNPPEWVDYDPENGTVTITPPPGPGGQNITIPGTVTNTTTGVSTPIEIPIVIPPADPPAVDDGGHEIPGGAEGDPWDPTDRVLLLTPYSYMIMYDPDRCTVTMGTDAAWLHYSPENRTFYGIPPAIGTYYVSAQVYDPYTTLSTWDNWTIEVYAIPPEVTSISSKAQVGAWWQYTLNFRPADALVELDGLPEWLAYDGINQTLYGTPTAAGTYMITVNVTDRISGLPALGKITLTVTLDAPVLVCNPPRTATERTLYQWTASADQVVTWTISGEAGSWLTIGSGTGRVSGTPTLAGTYMITLTVTNDRGVSSSYTYNLTVAPYKPGGTIDPGTDPGQGGIINQGGDGTLSASITAPTILLILIIVIVLLLLLRRRN